MVRMRFFSLDVIAIWPRNHMFELHGIDFVVIAVLFLQPKNRKTNGIFCHYGEKKTSQAENFELTKVILNKLNMEMTQCRSIPEYVIPVNPKFDYFDSNLVICALEHIPTFGRLSPMATIPITNFDVPVMTLINIHLHSKPFE